MDSILKKRVILVLIMVIILFAGIFIVSELSGFTQQTSNAIKVYTQPNQVNVGVNILPAPEGENGKK